MDFYYSHRHSFYNGHGFEFPPFRIFSILSSQRKEMQARIENLESTQVALKTQIAYSGSDKAVEEWARTYERMVQPGDQVIIPLPPKKCDAGNQLSGNSDTRKY